MDTTLSILQLGLATWTGKSTACKACMADVVSWTQWSWRQATTIDVRRLPGPADKPIATDGCFCETNRTLTLRRHVQPWAAAVSGDGRHSGQFNVTATKLIDGLQSHRDRPTARNRSYTEHSPDHGDALRADGASPEAVLRITCELRHSF
jgi:hypothetical protein